MRILKTRLKQLVLIRHCEAGHERVRYVGKTDMALTQRGRQQAEKLAKAIKKETCSHALSSPSRRCLETAEALIKGTAITLEQDSDLREIDFGRWEGLTFQEILARDPELVEQWALGRMDFRFPDGETLMGFWERVCRAAERLHEAPSERVLVVTHGGVIRFLLCYFLGLDTHLHLCFKIQPASVTRVHFQDGKAVLAGLNDLCHLGEL